jgi:hypothetical protein
MQKRIGAEIAEWTVKDQLHEQRLRLGASDMALNAEFRYLITQQTREIDALKVIYGAEESAASERLKRLGTVKISMQNL